MTRQSAGELLPPLKINIVCLEVSGIFNVYFFPGYLALLLMKWNRLECFNKSVFLCIYLFVIPQRYCRFLIQSPRPMRQIWSHTLLQVSKCLRMNLLSWFSTLTFAFLFSAKGLFWNVLLLGIKKAQKHNNKYISGAGPCASLHFPAFLRLNGGSVFTLVADNSATPDRVLKKKKRKQRRPGSQN